MTSMTHATAPGRWSGTATPTTVVPTSETAPEPTGLDRAAKDARETRLLLTIAGVGTLVVLIFFLTMMWILSGYGPTVQV